MKRKRRKLQSGFTCDQSYQKVGLCWYHSVSMLLEKSSFSVLDITCVQHVHPSTLKVFLVQMLFMGCFSKWTCEKGLVKQFIWRVRLMDRPNVVTEVLTGSFCLQFVISKMLPCFVYHERLPEELMIGGKQP